MISPSPTSLASVHRASATYRGEGKTDAKDAFRHRRPGPHPAGPGSVAALRRYRRRPAHPDQPAPGPRLRPHPAEQPPPGPTAGDLPRSGAVSRPDEQRPGHTSERLPDAGSHPPNRCEAPRDVAEEPQRERVVGLHPNRNRSASARTNGAIGRGDLLDRLVGAEWYEDEEFFAYGLSPADTDALRVWAQEWADDLSLRLHRDSEDAD